MPVRVSVLVPVYNGEAFLPHALQSALTQRFTDFEVVVVNDGSGDRSAEIAQEFARKDGRIRLIEQPNAGLPAARNAAIAAARGDYLALLDADDVWLPDHLERAVAVLDSDDAIGLVHAAVECIDVAGNPAGFRRRTRPAEPDSFRALLLRHEHVNCPTAVFRRRCIECVGGFDLRFSGRGCEDRDLWLRIAERYRIHYIDAVLAQYRVHSTSMSQQTEHMAQARQMLVDKFARHPRGAPLVRHARAMIQSDVGMDYMAAGQPGRALLSHAKALRIRPVTAQIWRRTLRPAFALMCAAIFDV